MAPNLNKLGVRRIGTKEYRKLVLKSQNRGKYQNVKVKIDGTTFDSKKEASRYRELKLLAKKGEIAGLKLQPEYILQVAFTDGQGKKHRAIKYRADFQYEQGNKTVVEDVKGMRTRVYENKKKMFLYLYQHLVFKEL